MIRCSAFFLSLDEGRGSEAAANAPGIHRVRSGSMVDENFEAPDGATWRLVALPTSEGKGLPVVHGLSDGKGAGEYAALSLVGNRIVASRDKAGTRPLFLSESGGWIASDWRFIRTEASTPLSAGATYDPGFKMSRVAHGQEEKFAGTFGEAADELARRIESAVADRVSGVSKAAVGFSGGLDSSIIGACSARHVKTVACAVTTSGSKDSAGATKAAEALGLDIVEKKVSGSRIDAELGELELPFEPTVMDKSLWSMFSIASREAAGVGAEVIMLGQLADELFGGYAKYQKALEAEGPWRAEGMMRSDVEACGTRGFVRDESACSRWTEPRFPFASDGVLSLANSLPVDFKIRGGVRKAVLREAALRLGVPQELADAPKKAAQYSSGIQKLIR